jgi:hypothetical protein
VEPGALMALLQAPPDGDHDAPRRTRQA